MNHLAPLIRDLAVILSVAGLVTLLFHRIRQPVVLGYLVAGIIVGPFTPPVPLVTDIPNIKVLAELGVIFLMFSLGLEFSFRRLGRVGMSAGFTAVFEVATMLMLGFAGGRFLGWSTVDSIFLGAMLSISSTTIIIKTLDEFGLRSKKFAELIFGILIVEDLVAILILVALSTFATTGEMSGFTLVSAAGKLLLVVGGWIVAGYFVVPRLIKLVVQSRSDEMLTLVSVGLCLFLVVVAASFHYSAALGAFIMGAVLAESAESRRIEELAKPLKDVFAAIFFVSVGMLIDPKAIWENRGAIVFISAITVAGKILSSGFGALLSGQKLKTSVQVGFGVAQIGEFSFIIATLGMSLHVMSDFLYPIAVAVSLITTFATPYLIRVAPRTAEALESRLPEHLTNFLKRYALWRAQSVLQRKREPDFNDKVLKWGVNGLVVTLIHVVIAEFALPFFVASFAPEWSDLEWTRAIGGLVSLILSAPFIWGMMGAFKSRRVVAQILILLWLGVLSLVYLPPQYAGLAVVVVGAFVFGRLYRHSESSYRWFERGFLSHLGGGESRYDQLAPWEGRLIRMKVHADAEIGGKRIAEIALRNRYGLNIVAIQRGLRAVVAPRPETLIFPGDELLMLGTDEQAEKVRATIEYPLASLGGVTSIESYGLRRFGLGEQSRFVGKTIRQSGLRENHGAMVVGVERGGQRLVNPDSDMSLEAGDLLWLVGETVRLGKIEG